MGKAVVQLQKQEITVSENNAIRLQVIFLNGTMTDLILNLCCMYSTDEIKVVNYMSGAKKSHVEEFSSLNRNLPSHSAPHKCPLSVLWRCPSYREFSYGKMTEKRPGPAPDVR